MSIVRFTGSVWCRDLPVCKALLIALSNCQAHAAKRANPAKLSARAKKDPALKPEIARVFAENYYQRHLLLTRL